jgi:hypothetical protein
MVANGAIWKVKANVVAREMLRAYFAQEGMKGVTKPLLGAASKQTGTAALTPKVPGTDSARHASR